MSTENDTGRASSAEEGELSLISQGAQALAELSVQISMRFGRAEVRKRVGHYLRGLLASVERKNGWQLAEELGEGAHTGCSGCWPRRTGMKRQCAMTCAPM